MANTKRTIELDTDADATLARLARERGAKPDAIASDAVRLYDELYGQAELEELDRRWADYARTGEGVPGEEVRAWMQSWGTPDELPPPKPRKLGS